jgi:hypothetical protein
MTLSARTIIPCVALSETTRELARAFFVKRAEDGVFQCCEDSLCLFGFDASLCRHVRRKRRFRERVFQRLESSVCDDGIVCRGCGLLRCGFGHSSLTLSSERSITPFCGGPYIARVVALALRIDSSGSIGEVKDGAPATRISILLAPSEMAFPH